MERECKYVSVDILLGIPGIYALFQLFIKISQHWNTCSFFIDQLNFID